MQIEPNVTSCGTWRVSLYNIQIITNNIQIINNPNYCAPLACDFLTSLSMAPFPMFAPCVYGGLELQAALSLPRRSFI